MSLQTEWVRLIYAPPPSTFSLVIYLLCGRQSDAECVCVLKIYCKGGEMKYSSGVRLTPRTQIRSKFTHEERLRTERGALSLDMIWQEWKDKTIPFTGE